jgi:hypothetical protein
MRVEPTSLTTGNALMTTLILWSPVYILSPLTLKLTPFPSCPDGDRLAQEIKIHACRVALAL